MAETTPENDPDPARIVASLCDEYAAKLAEHCESVVIICTYPKPAKGPEGPRTGLYTASRGNTYAQEGSVRTWLESDPTEWVNDDAPPEDREEWKGAES